ncbi:hypothetical protein E2C01_059290 [Portunus trituberculatus]|uniref:Uncharacterized protein n=1 Tax=Portunus trituberculatus TaxID=210409 RepID=A0A5B7GXL5_PORTR|nr:hypothetical protein [Portunus trituberculatus]
MGQHDTVPPLTRSDGTTATYREDKASLLAGFFTTKMTVGDMSRRLPHLPQDTDHTVTEVQSPAAPMAVSGHLCFGGQTLPVQEHIKVLGVTMECDLRFDHHVAAVANQASLCVSALRGMAGSLDYPGILTLYKAQI